jgi:hypothetical protein
MVFLSQCIEREPVRTGAGSIGYFQNVSPKHHLAAATLLRCNRFMAAHHSCTDIATTAITIFLPEDQWHILLFGLIRSPGQEQPGTPL